MKRRQPMSPKVLFRLSSPAGRTVEPTAFQLPRCNTCSLSLQVSSVSLSSSNFIVLATWMVPSSTYLPHDSVVMGSRQEGVEQFCDKFEGVVTGVTVHADISIDGRGKRKRKRKHFSFLGESGRAWPHWARLAQLSPTTWPHRVEKKKTYLASAKSPLQLKCLVIAAHSSSLCLIVNDFIYIAQYKSSLNCYQRKLKNYRSKGTERGNGPENEPLAETEILQVNSPSWNLKFNGEGGWRSVPAGYATSPSHPFSFCFPFIFLSNLSFKIRLFTSTVTACGLP